MAKINAYKFTPRAVKVYPEIWDNEKKTLTPIKSLEMVDMHMVLDSMVLAVEAGVVDTHSWPQQFFATKKVFIEFIQQLAEYDFCWRITDQWWLALAALAGVSDEEGFISTQDMAAELFTAAEKDGLLENWGKKNPAPKYTEEQFEEALFQCVKADYARGSLGRNSTQSNVMHAVIDFGRTHYGRDVLSKARYHQAAAEGTALLKKATAKKSPGAKKSPATKKKAK